MGKGNKLKKHYIDLEVDIVEYYKWLTAERKEYVMSKKILRSGTSIGGERI